MQSLHLNPTLKPLTTMLNDPDEPTNQIEEFYVKCCGSVTTTKFKVANAALTQLSITLVKNGHGRVEYKTPFEFSQTQCQPYNVACML